MSSQVEVLLKARANSQSFRCMRANRKDAHKHAENPYRKHEENPETPELKEVTASRSLRRPSIQRHPFPIKSLRHTSQHSLQDPIRIQSRATTVLALPGYRINHIPPARPPLEIVVQILQRVRRAVFLADLEELDADLPGRRVELLELLGGGNDDGFRVVGGDAVSDDDDVEGLHDVQIGFLGFAFPEVGLQDGVQLRACGGAAAGPDGLEDALHFARAGDVLVAG